MSQMHTAPVEEKSRTTLRDLPLSARVAITAFLASVAIGYGAALVQLKVQHARPGEMMPTPDDVVAVYHGQTDRPKSKIEILVEADVGKPFNGSGQMRAAFFKESTDWEEAILIKADFEAENAAKMKEAEAAVHKEREGEADALIAWILAGADKEAYEKDRFILPDELKSKSITEDYITDEGGQKVCKIQTLFKERCVRCHKPTAASDGKNYPMDSYVKLKPYITATKSGGMSLQKLAQTTHVHLLSFSMLYGITGIIFAFSSFPGAIRLFLAPAALVGQVVDVSFWWLARMEAPLGPLFAKGIVFTGGIVGAALALQILLSMLDMFGKVGRVVIILTLVAILAAGAVFVKPKLDNYLQQEKSAATATE